MRTLTIFMLLCAASVLSASAQQFSRIFLFDDFTGSQVKLRNGARTTIPLNYDAANKVMLFKQGDELMEMTNTFSVDTITVDGRKFVPAEKGFYEAVAMDHGVVYIDWLLKDVNIGSKGALGSVTQGTVQNLLMSDFGLSTEMYTPYQRQKLGVTDVYRRKSDNTYYIRQDGKLVKVKTLKQMTKAFPEHKEEITAFYKENNIDLKETQDVLSLLDYCLGLVAQGGKNAQ